MRFVAAAVLALIAQSAAADPIGLFRCTGSQAAEVIDGQMASSSSATRIIGLFQPVVVDGDMGTVRFSIGGGPQRWRATQKGSGNDLILNAPNLGDNIWIRPWQSPISFLANFNSLTIITGTCEVIRREAKLG